MEVPGDLRFTSSHEWVRINDDGSVTIGISQHAQDQLGDLVYVETPEMDMSCEAEQGVAVVESVKAASDIYSPIKGTVVACNPALTDNPELINSDPYGDGWIFTIMPDNPDDIEALMGPDDYQAMTENES